MKKYVYLNKIRIVRLMGEAKPMVDNDYKQLTCKHVLCDIRIDSFT